MNGSRTSRDLPKQDQKEAKGKTMTEHATFLVKDGAPTRTRTADLLITNHAKRRVPIKRCA